MKELLLSILGVLACVGVIRAQEPSPYSELKGKMILSQFHTLEKPATAEGIFLNALLWNIDNRQLPDNEKEETNDPGIETDYDKLQFSFSLSWINPKTASRYRCLLSVKVSENIITMLTSDITYEAETAVIKLVKRLPFEKLQPDKKPKHKEYMDEFAALHRRYVEEMLTAIAANQPPVISHWTEIREKNVAKGMTEAECLLAIGKPASIQKQGTKTEWMYDSYTYLFFENGVVSSFIK